MWLFCSWSPWKKRSWSSAAELLGACKSQVRSSATSVSAAQRPSQPQETELRHLSTWSGSRSGRGSRRVQNDARDAEKPSDALSANDVSSG